MTQHTSHHFRPNTLRAARLLSAGAILRRFGLNILYTLWLIVITYLINVLFNLADLAWRNRNGVDAVFRPSNVSHALLIDQTTALVFQLPAYVIPIVVAGALCANLLFTLRAAYKQERKGVKDIEKQIDLLKDQITEYNSKYGWHPFRDRIIPTLRGRPQRQRPVPTEAERGRHEADERSVRELEAKRASIDKSSQLEHYDQIETWLSEDPELVDLTDDLIKRKRFLRDMRDASFAPVAVIVASRFLAILVSR